MREEERQSTAEEGQLRRFWWEAGGQERAKLQEVATPNEAPEPERERSTDSEGYECYGGHAEHNQGCALPKEGGSCCGQEGEEPKDKGNEPTGPRTGRADPGWCCEELVTPLNEPAGPAEGDENCKTLCHLQGHRSEPRSQFSC